MPAQIDSRLNANPKTLRDVNALRRYAIPMTRQHGVVPPYARPM